MNRWRSTNWDFVVIGCAVTTVVSAVHADVIQVPADHLTIQSAIDAATDGDEIVLAMGTYPEQIDFTGKAITVRSVDPTLPEVVATTVIDAGGKGTAVALRTGEGPSAVLDGITITGGFGDSGDAGVNGGGLHVMGTAPTVSRCVFTGNTSGYGGGALLIEESTPVFIDCTFYANSAVTRGARRTSAS